MVPVARPAPAAVAAAPAAAAVRQGGGAAAGQQVGPTAVGLQRGVRELIMMSVAMPAMQNDNSGAGPGSIGSGTGGNSGGASEKVMDQKK